MLRKKKEASLGRQPVAAASSSCERAAGSGGGISDNGGEGVDGGAARRSPEEGGEANSFLPAAFARRNDYAFNPGRKGGREEVVDAGDGRRPRPRSSIHPSIHPLSDRSVICLIDWMTGAGKIRAKYGAAVDGASCR